MKTVTTFTLLILVVSMVFGGMTSNVSAQDDPTILLKIAKRAEEQIHNQISDDSSDKVKRLFEEGVQKVSALENALENDDISSAKEYFLSAMKIFTELSRQSSSTTPPQVETNTVRNDVKDPSNDLQRLQVYVTSLKTIAKKYNTSIDFSELDELFSKTRQEINDHQFALALETLFKIKEKIVELNKELREEASKQEFQRAKKYAQQYLEQLDRLIENAKKQGVADEIIAQLESAKENLSLADDKNKIIEQIRKIISIKDQFELTKNDRLESRVLQLEKTISILSQIDGVNLDDLKDARNTIQTIKRHLYNGEFETANDLLRDLAKQLEEIKNSS